MREDHSERNTWWIGLAALLPLLLCCGLPLLVATFGLAAVIAGAKWGLAGLGAVGLSAVGLYALRAAHRRRHGGGNPASSASYCDCDPTVRVSPPSRPRHPHAPRR